MRTFCTRGSAAILSAISFASAGASSVATAEGAGPPIVARRPRLPDRRTRSPGTYSPSAIRAIAIPRWGEPLRAMDHASPKRYRALMAIEEAELSSGEERGFLDQRRRRRSLAQASALERQHALAHPPDHLQVVGRDDDGGSPHV